jgi:hypothetical protein
VPPAVIAADHKTHLAPLEESFTLNATANDAGPCDVSAKGDIPSVVKFTNSQSIAIPDRLGNKRIDGHQNILANCHIDLVFMLPYVDDTIRTQGRCFIADEPDLMMTLVLQGRAPQFNSRQWAAS